MLTYELAAIKQTATILDLKDIKDSKDEVAKAIIDFLMCPTGKTLEEVQKDAPPEEDDEELDEEEEEVEVKPKKGRGGAKDSAGRPKRATATRVWTNGKILSRLSPSSAIMVVNYRLRQQRGGRR